MKVVLDASAILAFVQDEKGADQVEELLEAGTSLTARSTEAEVFCGAANWSEVAQKIHAAGRSWPTVQALLASYEIRVEPVLQEDGEWAASRWRQREGLSLADRLCLALGERLDGVIMTADSSWGSGDRIKQIR